jgi:hypothetical protein
MSIDAMDKFAIDDLKSFEENMVAFGDALVACDPVLGPVLNAALTGLSTGAGDKTAIWKTLHHSASQHEGDEPAEVKS